MVVESGNTYAGTEGLGGKSIVDCSPVEGVKNRSLVAVVLVEACPGVDGGAAGNVAEDGGAQGGGGDPCEGAEAPAVVGWEGNGGIGCVVRGSGGREGAGEVVHPDILAFRKGVGGGVGEIEVGGDLLRIDSEGEEGVKALEFIEEIIVSGGCADFAVGSVRPGEGAVVVARDGERAGGYVEKGAKVVKEEGACVDAE